MKIALIDDHQLVRDGFKRLIEINDEWQVVLEANNYAQAISLLAETVVDVAIIEISLPNISGIELVKFCSQYYPTMATIIVSIHDQTPYVSNALAAGANGYVSKRSASNLLLDAIVAVFNGNTYLSQDILNKLSLDRKPTKPSQINLLTERELEILPLLARGLNAKQIAQRLNIMPKTAHAHRINIYKKLTVSNSFELLKISLNSGIIALEELI